MKKFKSLKLMLLGVLAMGSMNAFADGELTNGTLKFTSSDGKNATITGCAKGQAPKDLEIPNKIKNLADGKEYTVTQIIDKAFLTDKGTIETIDLKVEAVTTITADMFSGLSKLKSIKLGSKVTAIEPGAFKGTVIENLDLSATGVNVINNYFATSCSHIGNYTADAAEAVNVEILGGYKKDGKGGTAVAEGDLYSAAGETPGTAFTSLTEILRYYDSVYDGIVWAGSPIPYTKASANIVNYGYWGVSGSKGAKGAVKAGDKIPYSESDVNDINGALEGAFWPGMELTAYKLTLYNNAKTANPTILTATYAEGDEITEASANAYNSILPGAINATLYAADPTGPYKDNVQLNADNTPKTFTDETAYDYNYDQFYGKAGFEDFAVAGNNSGSNFASTSDAYKFNNQYIVPAQGGKVLKIGDIDPSTKKPIDAVYYKKGTAHDPYEANYNAAKLIDATKAVKEGDPKDTPLDPVTNKSLTSVKLNKTWTTINPQAFEACTKLATIDFNTAAKSLADQPQTIGDKAFLGTALTELNFVGTNVQTLPSTVFVDNINPAKDSYIYTEDVPGNATLTTVSFNKIWKNVEPYTFTNCTALATVTFEDRDIATKSEPGKPATYKVPFGKGGVGGSIGAYAFANTAIAEITIPEALDATKKANNLSIDEAAFYGCAKLKKFTYMVDNESALVYTVVNEKAFPGCKDVLYNTTNANFAMYMYYELDAPKNTTFNILSTSGYVTPFETKEYKKVPGKYYIKYKAATGIRVKKDEAKVYDAYTDDTDNTLNMTLYKASGSYYNIAAGDVVLITTNKKDLQFETKSGISSGSFNGGSNALRIVEVEGGLTLAELDYMAGAKKVTYGWVNSATAGTGFQWITSGTKPVPQGTLYVFAAKPADGARLNVRWLDENGNVEAETTGIESIFGEEAADNEAIYNLQGVRVNGAQKGIFIKNGKKYVK